MSRCPICHDQNPPDTRLLYIPTTRSQPDNRWCLYSPRYTAHPSKREKRRGGVGHDHNSCLVKSSNHTHTPSLSAHLLSTGVGCAHAIPKFMSNAARPDRNNDTPSIVLLEGGRGGGLGRDDTDITHCCLPCCHGRKTGIALIGAILSLHPLSPSSPPANPSATHTLFALFRPVSSDTHCCLK